MIESSSREGFADIGKDLMPALQKVLPMSAKRLATKSCSQDFADIRKTFSGRACQQYLTFV